MPPPGPETTRHLQAVRSWLQEVAHLPPDATMPKETFSLDEHDPDLFLAESMWNITSIIFDQPYWERLWIIQEIVLADSIEFWYGEWNYSPQDIQKMGLFMKRILARQDIMAVLSVDYYGGRDAMDRMALRRLPILLRILAMCATKPLYLDLPNLVFLAMTSKVTDLRDKVYGLLALLPAEIYQKLQHSISYALCTKAQDVYLILTKACAVSPNGLSTIGRLGGLAADSSRHHLPTWLLDLDMNAHDIITSKGAFGANPFVVHNAGGELKGCINFSEDDTIMFCRGAFVEIIKTTNKTPRIGQEQTASITNESELHLDAIAGPSDDMRLALARALLWNSHYKLTDSPSPLDIRWFMSHESSPRSAPSNEWHPESELGMNEEQYWSCAARFERLRDLDRRVKSSICGDGSFEVNGFRLSAYFKPTELHRTDPEAATMLGDRLRIAHAARCICTTQGGLIGMVPRAAVPGDLIAILLGCSEPVVLRPKGENYQLIGSCFVEGLMKGEAIPDIDAGKFSAQMISIC